MESLCTMKRSRDRLAGVAAFPVSVMDRSVSWIDFT